MSYNTCYLYSYLYGINTQVYFNTHISSFRVLFNYTAHLPYYNAFNPQIPLNINIEFTKDKQSRRIIHCQHVITKTMQT